MLVELSWIYLYDIFQRYAQDAEGIWDRMKNFKDKNVNMSHDGYLKFYQLSRPSLRQYDCILIDEAQDLTPGRMAVMPIWSSMGLKKYLKYERLS